MCIEEEALCWPGFGSLSERWCGSRSVFWVTLMRWVWHYTRPGNDPVGTLSACHPLGNLLFQGARCFLAQGFIWLGRRPWEKPSTAPLRGWRSVCRAKLESCPSDSWCFPRECLRASPRQWQQLWRHNLPVRRLTNFWPQVSLSHKKPLFGQLKSLRQSLWHRYVRTYVHIHLPPSEPSP